MQCPKCGQANKPNAAFCANCGTRMQSAPQAASTKSFSGASSGSSANKTMIVQSVPGMVNSNASEVLIGRASNCDIVINDGGVSSKHAKIFVDNEEVFIEDLRSMNGTYVDGRKVTGKVKITAFSKINIGSYPLNLTHPAIANMINNYGIASFSDSGVLSLKINQTWVGKIFYFVMVILFFFPWIIIKGGTESISLSALDFAFNKSPEKNSLLSKIDYGPLNTLFLVIFILLIVGLILNFLKLRISNKLNWTNILSLVIFIVTVIYMYVVSSIDSAVGGFGSLAHTFSAYMFIFICFISMFEGLIEFYISEKRNY